ncbi:LITAF domain-containing protein-like [Antennarius striatus]|uniref:LITAF domain-containing protein-like n=1 Tax=Antennarius striatus TaxID=241820 RepID=UPI0035B4E5F2
MFTGIMAFPQVQLAPPPLEDSPAQIFCPKCRQTVLSEVEYSSGLLTFLVCSGLCIFGFGCGCCLIPFCVNQLKDVIHTCPTCKTQLGSHNRLFNGTRPFQFGWMATRHLAPLP